MVFLKYPIIGVVIEAVGFMGLFGSVLACPFVLHEAAILN